MKHGEIIKALARVRDWRFIPIMLWLLWESVPKRSVLWVLALKGLAAYYVTKS